MALLQNVVQRGTFASRPAAGSAGVLYFCSDTGQLYRDSGSGWQLDDSSLLYTARGQLLAASGSGAVGALAAGTDSYVLTADSSQSLGMKWAAAVAAYAGARYHQAGATAQSMPNTGTTIVNYDTADWDTGSYVTTGASWKFTAATAGKYDVRAAVMFASSSAANLVDLALYKNGTKASTLGRINVASSGGTNVAVWGSDAITLAGSDYIDLRVYQQAGGALTLYGDSTFNYCVITKIG